MEKINNLNTNRILKMATFKQFLLNEGNKVKPFYTSGSFELTAKRARTGGVTLTDELGYKTRAGGGGYDKFGAVLGNWIQDNLQPLLKELPDDATDGLYGLSVDSKGNINVEGAVGTKNAIRILKKLGYSVQEDETKDSIVFTLSYEK